jgi:hypothetical protein
VRFRGATCDEIDARRNIAPLIAAAHLQHAPVAIEELEEIVRLQHEIAELGDEMPSSLSNRRLTDSFCSM